MALAGQAVAAERRAFGMGIFFTVYYAIMTGSPPIAGWLVDITGSVGSAILFGAGLFAIVVPTALLFRARKDRTTRVLIQESV